MGFRDPNEKINFIFFLDLRYIFQNIDYENDTFNLFIAC
jgi:hypothetical protein